MSSGQKFSANKADLFAKSSASSGSKGGGGGTTSSSMSSRGPTATFTTASAIGASRPAEKRVNLEKLKEAEEYRLKGLKQLKTSMFGNWKPDFLSAVPYLDRAAALYKAAGADEQAKEMFVKSADCNERTNTFAAAATAYRNAAAISKEYDEEESASYLAKEADMWILAGDAGRGADSFVKAATTVEDSSPEKAVDYCLQACELLFPDGGDPMELSKAPLANDIFAKALNLCIRNDRMVESLKIAGKAAGVLAAQGMHTSLYKMYCTQTILQLYLSDAVAADQTFMEVHLQNSGYLRSPECECAENLLQAAKSMSNETLQEAVMKLNRAYLDNNVVKVARRLTVDRISGLGGDYEDESGSPVQRSPTPPVPTQPSTFNRKPTPWPKSPPKPDAEELEIDPDMQLSEEEKAALKKKGTTPLNIVPPSALPAVRSPAPVPAPAPRPQASYEEIVAAEPSPMSSTGMGTSGLMDLSDLQAGLEDGGEDEDLDALIEQAKAAASKASEPPQPQVVAPSPPSPAPPARQAAEAPSAPTPPSRPAAPKPRVPTSSHPAFPTQPTSQQQPHTSTSAAPHPHAPPAPAAVEDEYASPYSPGYQIPPLPKATPTPTPAPTPPQAQAVEEDEDFDLR